MTFVDFYLEDSVAHGRVRSYFGALLGVILLVACSAPPEGLAPETLPLGQMQAAECSCTGYGTLHPSKAICSSEQC